MLTELIRIVGNTNAMVARLAADVEVLKTEVSNLNERFSSLESSFTTFRNETQERFTDLEDDTSYLMARVARHEARIQGLRARQRAVNE